jgi:hypothetical protein
MIFDMILKLPIPPPTRRKIELRIKIMIFVRSLLITLLVGVTVAVAGCGSDHSVVESDEDEISRTAQLVNALTEAGASEFLGYIKDTYPSIWTDITAALGREPGLTFIAPSNGSFPRGLGENDLRYHIGIGIHNGSETTTVPTYFGSRTFSVQKASGFDPIKINGVPVIVTLPGTNFVIHRTTSPITYADNGGDGRCDDDDDDDCDDDD